MRLQTKLSKNLMSERFLTKYKENLQEILDSEVNKSKKIGRAEVYIYGKKVKVRIYESYDDESTDDQVDIDLDDSFGKKSDMAKMVSKAFKVTLSQASKEGF